MLCFDEFFVTDITDAMILATLMQTLFDEGVTLVATSNIEPDGLYRDGLQRARFLPAIELIKQHTKVMNVDGGKDHRLRLLEQAELFHCPLGEEADRFMAERFAALASEHGRHREQGNILVEGRKIATVKSADDVVWFDFPTCATARAARTTTSRSPANSRPCWSPTWNAWAPAPTTGHAASSTWWMNSTIAASSW